MPKRYGAEDDQAIGAKTAIESNWTAIKVALDKRAWSDVVDIWRGLPGRNRGGPGCLHAIHGRIMDYLTKMLALPPTKEVPYVDDQGLQRLIYLAWPDLPITPFYVEDLPDLMRSLGEYDRLYRRGEWRQFGNAGGK